jgi:nucleotide-binding universal stress UspA family protein
MSSLASDRLHQAESAADRAPKPAIQALPAGPRVLVAVDGTERTNALLDWVLGPALARSGMEVIVLNVQPEPHTGRLRGYGSFKRDQIRRRLVEELGKRAIASAARRLDRAGIRHEQRIVLGGDTQTLIRCAAEERCQMIVIGEPRPGAFRKWLVGATGIVFGSLAGEIVQLADVPVVVVK